jgi:repressor LexA
MSRADDGPAGQPEPRPEDDLTERQLNIVQAIRDSIEKRGFPPSLREIGDAVRLKSTSAVSPRVPSWLLPGSGRVFLLRITGDSMIGAGIRDGDLVLVRSQPDAENGDIVAAMIDQEATVKTLTRSPDYVWLVPHNPAYPPIPGDGATILGKIVSVLRKVE